MPTSSMKSAYLVWPLELTLATTVSLLPVCSHNNPKLSRVAFAATEHVKLGTNGAGIMPVQSWTPKVHVSAPVIRARCMLVEAAPNLKPDVAERIVTGAVA